LRALKDGEVGAVLAWHPDRLYRRLEDLAPLIEGVEATGAQIATVTAGELDLSTPSGRMLARILGTTAQFESDHKAERQKRKQRQIREAGGVSGGGHRAYGYQRDGMTLVVDEADEVRQAVTYVLSGGTLRGLLKDLNARGVVTTTGNAWSKLSLRRMLMSGRIAGLREHKGEVIGPAVWPAIISEDEHKRVRLLLSDPARRTTPGPARTYLLSGWVTCGRCGAALVGRRTVRHADGSPVRRYTCATDHGGCGKVGILAEPVEQMVSEFVVAALDSPGLGALVSNQASVRAAELAQQLADLADMLAAREMTRDQFTRANRSLMAEMQEAEAQAAAETRRGAVGALAGHLEEAWPTMTLDQRRTVIGEVVDAVVIAEATSPNRYDPSRVTVRWRA
jgi:hypothetical protein